MPATARFRRMRTTSGSGDVQGYKSVTLLISMQMNLKFRRVMCRPQLQDAGYEGVFQHKKRDRSSFAQTKAKLVTCCRIPELQKSTFSQDPIFHRGKYTAEGFLQHQMNISPESWMRHDEAVGSIGCRRRWEVNTIISIISISRPYALLCIPAFCQAVLLSTRPRGSAGLRSMYGT